MLFLAVNMLVLRPGSSSLSSAVCGFSTSASIAKEHYKLVVVGGGAAGAAIQAKFGKKLGKDKVAVVEPSKTHVYQAAWTLVGGGLKNYDISHRPQETVLNKATWIKDHAEYIDPNKNLVTTKSGKELEYDYLVICTGMQLNFKKIKGLPEAFDRPEVVSNYHPEYVKKTYPAIQAIQSGNALFSFPTGPIKCAGAPQKICYIADAQFRKMGKRDKINIIYNTSLPKIFGVAVYASALEKVCGARGIEWNKLTNLIEVKGESEEAVFETLDMDGKRIATYTLPYNFLHVGAPCSPVEFVAKNKDLSNDMGFVKVDKETLQHVTYPNVFGIGDCTDAPTAKTAAAVAAQIGIVRRNLQAVINNQPLLAKYDGYTSCPLVTGLNTAILAEFDYNLQPLETFPFDQAKERRTMFHVKNDIMPQIYWQGFVRGFWEGPAIFRKILSFGRR